ncbi:MAG TPA: hypothetical protein VEK77_03020 [Gemmatimonadales bacterium]|nr:hypothetical protein [Gemmatimonadales bacterium]
MAACLGERERPGPPQLSFTIDQDSVSASQVDTVSGMIRAEDPDGIDSVWVTVDAEERGENGGFDRVFSARYRFLVAPGQQPGTRLMLLFRARDIAGFEVQRDSYVVVSP